MESYPRPNFESGEPDKSSQEGKAKKKDGFTPSFESVSRPRSPIEKSGGDTALPAAEKRLPFALRPLGEAVEPSASRPPTLETDHTLPETAKPRPETTPEVAEGTTTSEQTLRTPTLQELAAMATREQREQLAALQHDREAGMTDTSQEDKTNKSKDNTTVTPLPTPKQAPKSPTQEQQQPLNAAEILRHNMPPQFVEATSGETLQGEGQPPAPTQRTEQLSSEHAPQLPPPAIEHLGEPTQSAETHVAFYDLMQSHPELAGLAAAVPEAATAPMAEQMPASYDTSMETHPDLVALSSAPEMAAAHPDQGFNDIVQHSLGEPAPGPSRFYEQAPGEPPLDAGGNGTPRPPSPPTAEGAADGTPESGDFGHQLPPNPDLLRNPWAPVGNTLGPAMTGTVLAASEARRRIDSLRHTAREAGLAGAVGILGLGLVLEHMTAKRRDKKQQREMVKQGRQLEQTNQALEHEQQAHQQTRQELHRLSTAQATTHNQLSRHLEHGTTATPLRAGEAAGLGTAAASTELMTHHTPVGKSAEAHPPTAKAAGEASPLQLGAQPLEQQSALKQALERQNPLQQLGQPELAAATAAALGINANRLEDETRHERLRDKTADATNARSGSGASAGGATTPSGTSSGSAGAGTNAAVGMAPAGLLNQTDDEAATQAANRSWIWLIVGLLGIAAVAALLAG